VSRTLEKQALSILRSFTRITPKHMAMYLYGSHDHYDVQAATVTISRLRKKGYNITRAPYSLIKQS